jgi:uncharacterized protein YfbU (UPF0304 family)
MTDFLICSLPDLILDRVPGAPALLKAAAESAGYQATAADLNIEFFQNQCNGNFDKFLKNNRRFQPNEPVTEDLLAVGQEWLEQTIRLIENINPRVLGLSVFSVMQHRATLMVAEAVRSELPDIKIVIGGFGIIINANSLEPTIKLKKIDLLKPFHQLMTEKNLVDQVFFGTDLDPIISYLQKICGPTAQTTKFDSNGILFNTPIPNYDDYKLDAYMWHDGKSLPITGSHGCVRKCTFCDIPGQFGKFSYRSGQHIFQEILHLKDKYDIKQFEFTDSLVNGSIKSFKEWLQPLAEYNDFCEPHSRIRWFGQYITRPLGQVPKDLYTLIKRSGVTNLVIGIESGSDEVLKAMKKQITVKDIYHELEMFEQHSISMHMLMLSGFYNETVERYHETLEFLISIQKYVANGVINKVSLGPPLFINEQMFLGQEADSLHIDIDLYNTRNWKLKNDPSNTLLERVKRRFITQVLLDKLQIPLSANSITKMHHLLPDLEYLERKLLDNESI